jgi:uncharacterized membrane protein
MDEDLQRLARELRSETCPRAVLDRVAQRIARDTPPRQLAHPFAWAIASLCVLGAITIWQWQARREAQTSTMELAAKTQTDRALVVQQTQGALVYIGYALLEAAAHTENALSKEAVPPLRNGFQTVKDKITNPI